MATEDMEAALIKQGATHQRIVRKTGIHVNRMSLKFLSDTIETAYRRDYAYRWLFHVKVSLVMISLLLIVITIWDWAEISSDNLELLIVPMGAVLPAMLIALGISYSPYYVEYLQPAINIASFLLSTYSLMTVCSGGTQYYPGILMNLVAVTLLLRVRFTFAIFLSLYLLLGVNLTPYMFSCTADHRSELATIGRETTYLVFVGAMLLFASYSMEYHVRKDFAFRVKLDRERDKLDHMLLNILPAPICERLKDDSQAQAMAKTNQCIADRFEEVTVLFADIVGFTTLSSQVSAQELVYSLNKLFCSFDHLAQHHGLEKIKTIGDCYMVAGGLPTPTSDHAERVADFALTMAQVVRSFKIESISHNCQIRIGINTGSVVAGVIGRHKFCYDLWGDSVNTASRMESHGSPGRVHLSESTYNLLKDKFDLEPRGEIDVKGKGKMNTYFLIGRKGARGQRKPSAIQAAEKATAVPALWNFFGNGEDEESIDDEAKRPTSGPPGAVAASSVGRRLLDNMKFLNASHKDLLESSNTKGPHLRKPFLAKADSGPVDPALLRAPDSGGRAIPGPGPSHLRPSMASSLDDRNFML
eukprot:GFYU01011171.1.p1 GENE.GFYU01011171.1~~GFYU01011171.1.p1  ORF type:complete len:586 (-),score=123.84 GFYU01011171.1:176-1933(-)